MTFDVAIVGAGLVGCALARALSMAGLRCALIDGTRPKFGADSWDTRVYSLSPATVSFLQRLEVWQSVPGERVQAVHAMRIFGDRDARLEFSAYECAVDRLATIAESGKVHAALWRSLEQSSNVSIHCPARPASLKIEADAAHIVLDEGSDIAARLVVGADGQHSWARTAAGIASKMRSLGQQGVVANFACSVPHGGTAFQWFRGDGVLAWLPLPGERVSMVWSTDDINAESLMAMTAEALSARVAEAGRHTLGSFELITPAASFPLARLSVRRRVLPRVALVGDAAQVIHPLAGQGVNLGFGDAEALAGVLAHGRDSGDWLSLRRFERSRAEDILAMRAATTGLQTLFEARWPGVSQLRNFGLNLTDRLPVVKNLLARRAMGPNHRP